jgi:hypothetical protein
MGMDVTARLGADNAQFDAAMKKSAENVSATALATEKAAKRSADAQQFASKFASDAVTQQSLKIVAAMKKQSEAQQDYLRAAKIAKSGYLEESEAANVLAATMQRLAAAKKQVAEASTGSSNSGDDITGALKKFAEFAAVGEVVNKLREMVSSSLEFGEAIQRASEKTGLSVGTLSTLHYAASITGGDFDKMTAAVAKMDKTIGAATEGDAKAQRFLKALGLNAHDLAGRTDGAEIAFKKFSSTLANTENPIRRVELATGLLGKAGAEQIPTLMQLGNNWDKFRQKAQDAGVQLDGQTAQSFEATQQRIKDLQQHVMGAGIAFTQGLTPGLTNMLNVATHGKSQMDALKSFGNAVARGMAAAAAGVYAFASGLELMFAISEGGKLTHIGTTDLAAAHRMNEQAQEFRDIAMGKNKPSADDAAPIVKGVVDGDAGAGFAGTGGDPNAANKAAEKRLKAYEANLAEMKTQTTVSAVSEYQFWAARIDAFKKGSDQYNTIVEKQAAIAVSSAKAAHEAILKFKKEANENANLDSKEANAGIEAFNQLLREQAEDVSRTGDRWKSYNAEIAKSSELMTKNAAAIRAAQIQQGIKTGTLSKYDAAQMNASDHVDDSSAKIAALQKELAELKATQANLDPNSKDFERQAPQNLAQQRAVQNQIDVTKGQAQLQALEDQWTVFQETAVGGAITALQEFTASAMDNAAQMKSFVTSTLGEVNKTILDDITGSRKRGEWTGVGKSVATNVAGTFLKKGESALLGGALGSRSNPMWVKNAGLTGTLPSSATASSSTGGILGMLAKFIPAFADGGDFLGGTSALVGENGPEIVNFGSSGHVTPNSKLSAIGGTQHNWNIDARGSTNPAQTMAMVRQGIMEAAPHLVAASLKAHDDKNSRLPPSARR